MGSDESLGGRVVLFLLGEYPVTEGLGHGGDFPRWSHRCIATSRGGASPWPHILTNTWSSRSS